MVGSHVTEQALCHALDRQIPLQIRGPFRCVIGTAFIEIRNGKKTLVRGVQMLLCIKSLALANAAMLCRVISILSQQSRL